MNTVKQNDKLSINIVKLLYHLINDLLYLNNE